MSLSILAKNTLAALKIGSTSRFGFLDQLRALACLPVVLSHLNPALLPGGGIGVGIFFALSGYLISTICIKEVTDVRSASAFVIRRIFRVYPLMLVDLALLFVAYTFFYRDLDPNFLHALPNLLLMHGMPSPFIGIGVGVLWTLQVEFAFYILAPVLSLIFGAKRGLLILAIGLLGTSVGLVGMIPIAPFQWAAAQIELIPILHWGGALALGVLVALVRSHGLFDRIANNARLQFAPAVLAIVALVGIAILFVFPPVPETAWHLQILLASAAGSMLIVAWSIKPNLPVIPGLPFIGRVSFSIYLIHAVLADYAHYLNQTIGFGNAFADPFVFIPLVICLAYASYRLVERPGIRLGASLSARVAGPGSGTHSGEERQASRVG